jgi:NTP pyrophosphatase (non-canonical NTP hydrolase)
MLKYIKTLSLQEQKTLLERMVKLQEETGELAQEVLIHSRSSGSLHKKKGDDGIKGESIDVVIVALSIFFHEGGTVKELGTLLKKKLKKWEQFQAKR